jgi:hypothetical protein
MYAVKMPLDLTQIPPFRELKTLLGSAGTAHSLWWELWRELGYHAQEGFAIGRLSAEAVVGFKGALAEQGLEAEPAFEALIKTKVLVLEGEDFFCPRFANLNADMRAAKRESLGGIMKRFHGNQRKAASRIVQQTLSISEDKFKDADGNPLSSEETKRVTMLIIGCDNALFKPERPSPGFTEGLIQDAVMVARKMTDDEVNYILLDIARKRDHPFLTGMTTERLLPQFKDTVQKLQ